MIDRRAESIPTETDWADYNQSEQSRDAYTKFFGKTVEQVQALFREDPVEACEHLYFMPAIPFRYYIGAAHYLQKDFAEQDFDEEQFISFADCLFGLIRLKLNQCRQDIAPTMSELLPLLEFLSSHLESADNRDYEPFDTRLADIKAMANMQTLDQPRSDKTSIKRSYLAETYLRHCDLPLDTTFWAWVEIDDLGRHNPVRAWSTIKYLLQASSSLHHLGYIAAGPLEDLLNNYGLHMENQIIEELPRNLRLQYALTCLYTPTSPKLLTLEQRIDELRPCLKDIAFEDLNPTR